MEGEKNFKPQPANENLESGNEQALWNKSEAYTNAVSQGENLISRIENFDQMDYREQLAELTDVLATLTEDNGNRFIAEYISARMYDIEISAKEAELEADRPDLAMYNVAA